MSASTLSHLSSLCSPVPLDRTPLHCAASCNDLRLCEYLVRNGAAVMAVTESDGATASQKCDPFAVDFEECEGFLRGEGRGTGSASVSWKAPRALRTDVPTRVIYQAWRTPWG